MIDTWKKYEFSDCLIDNNVGRANQINASEIKKEGRFPVVDQGQDFIAGYSDAENKLVQDGLPYVIFGDHTRCFKFIDFPFIVGADGTKVLSPNPKLFDPKYFYYQLLSFDIPSRGYNRHYKLLKEKLLQRPELPEQRKIAYVLSTVQKAIEMQDKLIRHTTELKKALMQKLFTEGTKGEKQKQTEIGLVPESWEEIIIGDLGKCVTGTTPKTAVEEYWNSNDFDFIAPADIGNTKYVYNSAKMMSNEGLKVSRILPKNSVLCVCIGSSIGKVGLTFKDQSATNQQINSIICKAEYNPIYTYYLLVQYAEHWRGHATFGPVPILNKGQFELIKIFVTKDKQEQSLIAESLQTFDSKIEFHGKKKQSLYNLFKTLLHELMTGERRVHEIEFEALTKAYKIKEQPLSMAAEK